MIKLVEYKKIILAFLLFTIYYLLFTELLSAQTACPPIFGGGETCEKHPDLSIDKQVQDPQSKKFTDSLTTVSNFLGPGQALVFKITIKNTSNKTISGIELADTLPQSLYYESGDGKYDFKTHKFSDTIEKLDRGQSKIYTINTSINQDKLETSSACGINHAVLTQNNKKGSDYVKICINTSSSQNTSNGVLSVNQTTKGGLASTNGGQTTTKGGLPVFSQSNPKKTPDTGPEMVGILALPSLAGIGYFLRKQSSKAK